MSPPAPMYIPFNGTNPVPPPRLPAISHADVVAGKISLYIIDMFFALIIVYFLVEALNGDEPLLKLNEWMDQYEAWIEDRRTEGFEALIKNLADFAEELRAPLQDPPPPHPRNNRPVAYLPPRPAARE